MMCMGIQVSSVSYYRILYAVSSVFAKSRRTTLVLCLNKSMLKSEMRKISALKVNGLYVTCIFNIITVKNWFSIYYIADFLDYWVPT